MCSISREALEKTHETVEEEPRFTTDGGLRKPDLIARKADQALVVDVQVVGEHISPDAAPVEKAAKYKHLRELIKERYNAKVVAFITVTLSYRGV